jgi:hypothetical protein
VNKNRTRNYRKDFVYRLWAAGVSDEAFIEQFYEGEEVERSLKMADTRGDYEDELGTLVELAVDHYERYGLASLGRGQGADIQEPATIRPKTRRSRKPTGVAGAWERQEALAQYLATVALGEVGLRRFRKDVLSARFLSAEEALTFLGSPSAAARGKPSSFKSLRINPLDRILDTNYKFEESQDDRGSYRKLVWGRHRSSTIRPLLVTTKPIFPGDSVTPEDLRILRRGRAVIFPHPREKDRFVVAAQDSFIGQLVELVEKDMAGYPITTEMGVWFILTGEFFAEDPVHIRYTTVRRPWVMSRTTITLEVESWVPPEEVLEQYRHAQHEVLGKTPRSLKRDTLAVLELVNQHDDKSWRERLKIWNKGHPQARHFKDPRHLYQSYMRAVENVAGVKPVKEGRLEIAGTDPHGMPIFAGKWYLLHTNGNGEEPPSYTGSFESREEAQDDPRSENSEVLTAKQLVARLAVKRRCLELSDDLNTFLKATNEQDPEETMRQYYDGRLRDRVDGLRMSLQQYGQWKPRDDVKQKLEYPETPDDLWSIYSYIKNIGVGKE